MIIAHLIEPYAAVQRQAQPPAAAQRGTSEAAKGRLQRFVVPLFFVVVERSVHATRYQCHDSTPLLSVAE
jgi:hypothetical protein